MYNIYVQLAILLGWKDVKMTNKILSQETEIKMIEKVEFIHVRKKNNKTGKFNQL